MYNVLLQSMESTNAVSFGKTIIFASVDHELGSRPICHELRRVVPDKPLISLECYTTEKKFNSLGQNFLCLRIPGTTMPFVVELSMRCEYYWMYHYQRQTYKEQFIRGISIVRCRKDLMKIINAYNINKLLTSYSIVAYKCLESEAEVRVALNPAKV